MRVTGRVFALGAITFLLASCQKKGASHPAPAAPAPVPAAQPEPDPQPQPTPPTPTPDPKPDPQPEKPNLPLTLQPTTESVQALLVDKACISCHASASSDNGHVALADLTKVILPPGAVAPHDHTDPHFARADLVRTGCPDQSFFYTIMKEGKMPLRAAHVSAEDLATVETWIKSLGPVDAPADFCRDPSEPGDDDDDGPWSR